MIARYAKFHQPYICKVSCEQDTDERDKRKEKRVKITSSEAAVIINSAKPRQFTLNS